VIQVCGAGHFDGLKLEVERNGGRLRLLVIEDGTPGVGIPEKRHAGKARDHFPQKLEPLPTEIR
jgi:hypothetical protein